MSVTMYATASDAGDDWNHGYNKHNTTTGGHRDTSVSSSFPLIILPVV